MSIDVISWNCFLHFYAMVALCCRSKALQTGVSKKKIIRPTLKSLLPERRSRRLQSKEVKNMADLPLLSPSNSNDDSGFENEVADASNTPIVSALVLYEFSFNVNEHSSIESAWC